MKLSANEAIAVVDKLTKLDMKSATSAQELAQALSKVANSARLAKVSQDEILGILSVGIETTQQSGDVIGTAVRSLLARFSNVKASKFGGSGEETEGTLNDTEAVLSKIGIRIRNASGEMRSFMDVLDDVAEKWDTLDDVSRNAISTAMAGTRQKEIFASIIENYDRVKELIGKSANAAGTADEKYTAYMDSMEAATKRLQNAWEGFTQSLEVSPVMKFSTNTIAGLVENIETLLKYGGTLLAALNSAKIVSAFAQGGAVGGFWGLVKEIPIVGDLFKFNDNIKRIADDVATIKNNQVAETKAGIKGEGRFSRFIKGMTGRQDVIDPKTGNSFSIKELKEYRKAFKDDPEAMAELDIFSNILKKRRLANAGIGAATTFLTQAFTNKSVGAGTAGGEVAKFLGLVKGDNEQSLEETDAGKALRVGLSTGVAAAGGAIFGPLGAMLGNVIGEASAGLISAWVHHSELEMKQRVADAKEQLKILGNIQTASEEGNEIMSEKFLDTSGYDKLNKYVDNLIIELNKLNPTVVEDILEAVRETGKTTATTVAKLGDDILNSDSDTRNEIQKALDIALAERQYEELVKTSEEAKEFGGWRNSIFRLFNTGINKAYSIGETQDIIDKYADVEVDYTNAGTQALVRKFQIKGGTITEKIENAQELYRIFSSNSEYQEKYSTFISDLQKYVDSLNEIAEMNKQIRESQIQIAYLKSGISDLTDQELSELTMDGVVYRIVDSLEKMDIAVRDTSGEIKSEYLTQIKSMIKANSDLAVLTKADTKTIGELNSAWDGFIKTFGEGAGIYEEAVEALRRGKFQEFLEEHKIEGDAEALEKLVYAANPERIEQFASAWSMTTDAAKRLAEEMPNLTTALGLMTTTEIADRMSKIATIFSDLSEDGKLTVENFNSILKNYPEYIGQLDDYEALIGALGKTLTEESLVAYENALFGNLMSDEGYYKKFKEQLPEELSRLLTGTDAKNLTDVLNLAQTNEDFAALNNELAEFLNKTYELEIDNPLRDLAIEVKEGLLDKQISNLNEQKDALSKINDERKKELEYIKAKIALEDARKEKKRVYVQGVGWTYVADDTAISEAKEKVDSLDIERQQNSIQLQIDSLEQQKEILDAIKNNEQLEKIEEALGKNGISTSVEDIATMMSAIKFNPATGKLEMFSEKLDKDRENALTKVGETYDEYQKYVKNFDKENFSSLPIKQQREMRDEINRLYENYTEAYSEAVKIGANVSGYSTNGKVKEDELADYQPESLDIHNIGRGIFDWGNDDIWTKIDGKRYKLETTNNADIIAYDQSELTAAHGGVPLRGDFLSYKGKYYVYNGNSWEAVLRDRLDGASFYDYMTDQGFAKGTLSTEGGQSLINELGTEAIITPNGTVTALPSKTGIVPADITKNLWSLGEIAPTLVASLKSLTQKPISGNVGNTTYEEGQYFDHFVMNVYPTKDYDMDKLLREARAKANLTKHNN